MKDFSVEVRIRNNQLRQRRLELGMTQEQIAAAVGISKGRYNELEAMRESPLGKRGWSEAALALARFHVVPVEELFPDAARQPGVTRRQYQVDAGDIPRLIEAAHAEAPLLPSEAVEHVERHELLSQAMSTLSSREQRILRQRFGFDGGEPMTLAEIARKDGVAVTRIHAVEQKALRKLRHPALSDGVEVFSEKGVKLR